MSGRDGSSSDRIPEIERVEELRRALQLEPHPEGGWYREIHRSDAAVDPLDGRGRRSALTGVYFLMADGQHSAWHRVDSDEIWIHFEGAAVRLWTLDPKEEIVRSVLLGPLTDDAEPQRVVPAGVWQAAEPLGDYSLTGAAVGPGFDFSDFRLLDAEAGVRRRLEAVAPDLLRLA
jgi:predicted cupin superfamily sugar epimerase